MTVQTVFIGAVVVLLAMLLLSRSPLAADRDRLRMAGKPWAQTPAVAASLAGALQTRIDPDVRKALALFGVSESAYSLAWLAAMVTLVGAGLALKGVSPPAAFGLIWVGVFGPPNLVRAGAGLRRMILLRDLPMFFLLLDMYLTRMPLPDAVRALLPSTGGLLRREVVRFLVGLEERPAADALAAFRDRLGVPAAEAAIEALSRMQMEGGLKAEVLAAQGEKLDELAEASALARAKAMPYILVGGQAVVVIASFVTFAMPLFHIVIHGVQSL